MAGDGMFCRRRWGIRRSPGGSPWWLALLLTGCASSDPASSPSVPTTHPTSSILAYVSPEQVSLESLLRSELAKSDPTVICIFREADELVRRGVEYRHDSSAHVLTRADLSTFQHALSCSEFVWYVCSLCGLDMGDRHVETREMAYTDGVYENALVRVTSASIEPGDILVYEFPETKLEHEQELAERVRSGHTVIVVSCRQRIVVSSHFHESTPPGAPTGAGYRKLLNGWGHWTEGRTLRAVYRIRQVR